MLRAMHDVPEPKVCPQCGHGEEEHEYITFELERGGAVLCRNGRAGIDGGCTCLRTWIPDTTGDAAEYTYVVGLVQSFAHDDDWEEDRLLNTLAAFERRRRGSVPDVETSARGGSRDSPGD